MVYLLPIAVAGILLLGMIRKINVLEEFIQGAKEGLTTLVQILPIMVLMLTALSMLSSSGATDACAKLLAPICEKVGIPPELIPMAVLRPISGSGSMALLSDCLQRYGADSNIGRMASVLAASSETTVYTYAVYCAAAKMQKIPYALLCGLLSDLAAFIFSVLSVTLFFR